MSIELQLLMLRGMEATKPTSKPLYPRGTPQPTPAPWQPPATQGMHAATVEASDKFWSRPRCMECLSVVIVHRDLGLWHCSNLACGRHGWMMHGVRTVDNEPRAT